MHATSPCQSCGMPLPGRPYCQHCIDPSGKLHPFEQQFERTLAWQRRQRPGATPVELERATLAYLAAMPAWENHPRIRAEFPDLKPASRPDR